MIWAPDFVSWLPEAGKKSIIPSSMGSPFSFTVPLISLRSAAIRTTAHHENHKPKHNPNQAAFRIHAISFTPSINI